MESFAVARALGQTIDYASASCASDIHVILTDDKLQIFFRIAGQMTPYLSFTDHGREYIRRIKALARMDITDHHCLQEGSFTWETSNVKVRLRVSSVPLVNGESIVLRLLYPRPLRMEFCDVGFTRDQIWTLTRSLESSHGLVLIAGKTGVGKTTTLYACMRYLADRGRQVFSVEDPVEMPLVNVRQVEVRERFGITYEASLRALLRQDPDVLMIGEIRDEVTARAAVRAALSGRMVLATTHAKSGEQTVRRLLDFGVSKEVLDDLLELIVVQEHLWVDDAISQPTFTLVTPADRTKWAWTMFGEGRDRFEGHPPNRYFM